MCKSNDVSPRFAERIKARRLKDSRCSLITVLDIQGEYKK